MNIIKHRKIFYIISGILVIASIISLSLWGLKLGIDFTGGSLLEVDFKEVRPSNDEIRQTFTELNLGNFDLLPVGEKNLILRFQHVDEPTHLMVVNKLKSLKELEEKRFESIGPSIGKEMKGRALSSILIVLLMIIAYIAWAFRKVSKPVSSFYYGIASIVALFHDVIIPPGIFAILGHFYGVEVNLLFVTGLLTVLGFSVHDTIVVFDRIRENLRKGHFDDFETTVNESIKQTFSRSVATSLTVLLTVLAIYLFGGESTKEFSLLLIFGLFFGTYSSIFIASPLLVSWEKYQGKK